MGAAERDHEEKRQSGNRRVVRDRRDAPIHAVQLIATQILGAGRVRRTVQPAREVSHGTDVPALRQRCQLAQPHVLDNALTQR